MALQSVVASPRRIKNLRWVELARRNPWPKTRLKGAPARGRSFERKVQKELARMLRAEELPNGELVCNQWLAFEDERGRGFAQPDAWIAFPRTILLVECKLTQTDVAEEQLLWLYRPLLERLLGRPVLMLQACKYLRHSRDLVDSPRAFLEWPKEGPRTWHYLP